MRLATLAALLAAALPPALGVPAHQLPLAAPATPVPAPAPDVWAAEEGVGHFSEWSKAQKRQFVTDVAEGRANEWVLVMGNEGGDLDSMTAALTWAYHLSHNNEAGNRTIALLQTPRDALDLRPENKLALRNVLMSPGHRDLLTIDELPIPPREMAKQIKGIVLVDHPAPLSDWEDAKVQAIFDHHLDRGAAPNARPRIFEPVASCTTIVARQMLDELEARKEGEYHLPHEVVELVLDAIAIDSKGLTNSQPADKFTAQRLLRRSNWRDEKLYTVMARLDDELSAAKKALDELGVRDLLRRDWKGDLVKTADGTPDVHVGFASVPLSLVDQVERTLYNTTEAWFGVLDAFSKEIGVDVTISLHSYKLKRHEDGHPKGGDVLRSKKIKVREIVLAVRPTDNVSDAQATSLFDVISKTIEESPFLDTERWPDWKQLKPRQMIWVHHSPNGGRKLVRPIVEAAIADWRASLVA